MHNVKSLDNPVPVGNVGLYFASISLFVAMIAFDKVFSSRVSDPSYQTLPKFHNTEKSPHRTLRYLSGCV